MDLKTNKIRPRPPGQWRAYTDSYLYAKRNVDSHDIILKEQSKSNLSMVHQLKWSLPYTIVHYIDPNARFAVLGTHEGTAYYYDFESDNIVKFPFELSPMASPFDRGIYLEN